MDVFFTGEAVPSPEAGGFRIGMRAGSRLYECTITEAAVAAVSGRPPRSPEDAVEMFRRHEGRFGRVAAAMLAGGAEWPELTITGDDVTRQGQ